MFGSLYTGEVLPIEGTKLRREAAALMDIMKIPSAVVAEAVPELEANLIYTDVVRDNYPNLAELIRKKNIYTLSALTEKTGLTIDPDSEMSFVVDFNGDAPEALKGSSAIDLLADFYGISQDVLLSSAKTELVFRPEKGNDHSQKHLATHSKI